MIDRNTIAALRDGSHDAFELVYRAFHGRVRAFIFGYVKSDADAEELTQELFAGLWVGRQRLDPSRSLGSYLHTVARNAALNFLRQKLTRSGAPFATPQTASALQAASASSEEEMIARETALLIELTVGRMSAQRREIYRLSRSEGLSGGEIADRLGTTKRNVESQLSATLREIRHALLSVLL